MSKKRFTDGLESLIEGESSDSTARVKELLLFPEMATEQRPASKTKISKKKEKRPTQKGFAAELQSFLTEAFEESFEAQMSVLERDLDVPQQGKSSFTPKRRPPGGLDALIRSTLEPDSMSVVDYPVRRIVLTFDEEKIEKLQHIAQLKKTVMKDMISEIVSNFIQTYEKKKHKAS